MPSLPELCSGKILLELADILMKPLGHGGFTVEVASPHPENRLVRGRLPSTAAAMCGGGAGEQLMLLQIILDWVTKVSAKHHFFMHTA